MEALVGYALLNQRLPCPDISTSTTDNRDGFEDALTGAPNTCALGANTGAFDFTKSSDSAVGGASWGDLPWKTLGLAEPYNADAWNNRLRYAVVTYFALPPTSTPNLTGSIQASGNSLLVYCRGQNATGAAAPGCISPAYSVSSDVAFVVYSTGANGWGSTSISSLSIKAPFTAAQLSFAPDEAANAPETKAGTNAAAILSRRQYLTRDRTEATSLSGEFDDLLSFMPRAKLTARLMNAGLYP